ncbi:hypothetical protein CAFE_37630 [Caprobacter fermentans]|uniref:Glycosyltransferase 2-like domain-containing protein n=1 Tax=Caproicibacter fermentans TaxID=2576756 RepID=A0A6N8I624_9FIRM|nr:hypothetical protein [Caproicibacter fermentans]MVB13010.1 hypothetical protein [Caproicibacter fermentans]OCN02460.1 hypothetical protein A7X67_15215 [Clostridium sp. W14A]QNK41276.1 hypothetical protein HCR03_02945 [Caproicibacter fermentans]
MFEIIFKSVFVLFAILGIVEAFRMFLFWLLKTKNPGGFFLIVSMTGHDEEAELVLRSACERIKWFPDSAAQLLVVDCGMDEETRRICEIACYELPEIRLCRPDEVQKILCR